MKIGYTGTRKGMSKAQRENVNFLLGAWTGIEEVHHGDCLGGDAEFDSMCKKRFKRVSHPPMITRFRAWCKAEIVLKEKPYLARDRDIAKQDILIATPYENKEKLRSGTWTTIRYAKQNKTPIYIIFPDGTIEVVFKNA